MDEEGMTETPNKLIHIGHPIDVDEDRLYYALRVMKEAAANETDDMRLLMQSICISLFGVSVIPSSSMRSSS